MFNYWKEHIRLLVMLKDAMPQKHEQVIEEKAIFTFYFPEVKTDLHSLCSVCFTRTVKGGKPVRCTRQLCFMIILLIRHVYGDLFKLRLTLSQGLRPLVATSAPSPIALVHFPSLLL